MKKQFLLYAESELVEGMDELAKKFGRKSGNVVAVEILEQYADFWEAAEQAKQNFINQQRAGVFGHLEVTQPYMSGKGSRREIERVTKDAQSREAKKRKK
jgi:hypothetical protein